MEAIGVTLSFSAGPRGGGSAALPATKQLPIQRGKEVAVQWLVQADADRK